MKQRKGFTLIELMIVIAIIIILAAIAIPNYLRMTDRARRARIAGDFASIATSLEAYSVDWGSYPIISTDDAFGKGVDGTVTGMVSETAIEITGTDGTTFPNVDTVNYQNASGNTTLTGEDGGIEYIKAGTVASMYNPFIPTASTVVTAHDECYWYVSDDDGSTWTLYVVIKTSTPTYLARTDTVTDLREVTVLPTAPMP